VNFARNAAGIQT